MYKRILIWGYILVLAPMLAAGHTCQLHLWPPHNALLNTAESGTSKVDQEVIQQAQKLLHKNPKPLARLQSAGQANIHDRQLIVSRLALQDADRAAIFALAYRLTDEAKYFLKTKDILVAWAQVNRPTGHPIDETRLDGLLWAYDLIACELSPSDKSLIVQWLETLYARKKSWAFGKHTATNNHRIHQLKILLILDKILQHPQSWEEDLLTAKNYLAINLNPQTGVSIDYLERDAIYYHNYVLQAWLEICLITQQTYQPVMQAFALLQSKILTNQIKNEFIHSQAYIDQQRAKGGFKYAQKGGTFDVTHAATTIVTYYTLDHTTPQLTLWSVQKQKKSLKLLFLRARREFWFVKHV